MATISSPYFFSKGELHPPVDDSRICAACRDPLGKYCSTEPISQTDTPEFDVRGEDVVEWYARNEGSLPFQSIGFVDPKTNSYYQLENREKGPDSGCKHSYHLPCLVSKVCFHKMTNSSIQSEPPLPPPDCPHCIIAFKGFSVCLSNLLELTVYWDLPDVTALCLSKADEFPANEFGIAKNQFDRAYRHAAYTNAHHFRKSLLEKVVQAAEAAGVLKSFDSSDAPS